MGFTIHSLSHFAAASIGTSIGTGRAAPWLLCAALLAMSACPKAEIYRYQDADGNWVFTDRRQGNSGAADAIVRPGRPEPVVDDEHDLADALERRFQPASAVETSSLAVVKVNSPVGSGSGFFVTSDGMILTNRHVVKPPDDWARKQEEYLELVKAQLDEMERKLSYPRERYADTRDYDRGKQLLRERSLEYRQAKRELEMKRYATQLQSAFEIELKDGTSLSADLVNISTNHDLALLQLKGYRTPFIKRNKSGGPRQTDSVYAIGSPLGIADTITIGTFTGTRDGLLVTDARILPGNSGGPMVNQNGEAVGVNTFKATAGNNPNERGFGLAIPIETAFDEFSELRR